MIHALSETQLFGGIETSVIADISAFTKKLELQVGDTVIGEHERHHDDLFLLIEGDVEVVSNKSGITSGEVVLSKRDVELFGEIRWLVGSGRTATVRCVSDAVVLQINGQALMAYLASSPKVGFEVMRRVATQLSRRIQHSDILLKQLLWMGEV